MPHLLSRWLRRDMTDPKFPLHQFLRDAAKHGELVVFIGAGASMLCGSPDWRGFANQVVGLLEGKDILSFLEAEQLRGLGDSRRTLSIALALAKEKGVEIDFDKILHPSKPEDAGLELYQLLSELRPVFVTTNYDKWLDDLEPKEITTEGKKGSESEPAKPPSKRPKYYLREHLSSALLTERGAVIHLHGSYTEPSSMVVSLKEYIEHYADPRVQDFLSAMFKNYTVLFVGYGLAELELLDQIIRSNEALRSGPMEPRHFLLFACRSTETVQTRFVERFFRDQCEVHVIPYSIDAKGYKEVVEVFKVWRSELDVRDATILDLQLFLDRCVAASTDSKRHAALRLVEKHPELTSYLVNSLKGVEWFDDLDQAGYFDVKHSPAGVVVEATNGTTHKAEGWPALRYLEQVTPLVRSDQADRIADIVRAVSADSAERGLDNWRTRWSLATIISQLPLQCISAEDIQMVRSWLDGPIESNMVGQELGEKLLPRFLDSSNSEDWSKALALVDALSMKRSAKG